jgi:hypothetical protein
MWRTRGGKKSWESGVATSRVRHGICACRDRDLGRRGKAKVANLGKYDVWSGVSTECGSGSCALAGEPTGLGQRDELGGSRLGKRGIVRSAPAGRSKQREEGRLVPVPLTGTGPVSRHCPTLPADCTF